MSFDETYEPYELSFDENESSFDETYEPYELSFDENESSFDENESSFDENSFDDIKGLYIPYQPFSIIIAVITFGIYSICKSSK
jgi:hypothetical protein